ncbi:FtsK/SpoIIIE domain-containing protein [Streptomyces tubercidicus]|uniref:FtsK/SpoIIIE domain-containing protein n=1 Tax=Streptomyces tubercidicus TaxID=47759 RepID=UPI002E14AF3C
MAGLPGYGKTSLVNALITRFAPSDAVQFAVVDGKAPTALRGDYADTAERLFAFVGDDPTEANELFRRLVRLLEDRMEHMRQARARTTSGTRGLLPRGRWWSSSSTRPTPFSVTTRAATRKRRSSPPWPRRMPAWSKLWSSRAGRRAS